MSQPGMKEVYVFCDTCKENVRLRLPIATTDKRVGGLLSIVSVHGAPPHAMVAYIDAQFRVRGIEYPQTALSEEPDRIEQVAETVVKDLESQMELGLMGLVDSLSEKRKEGVKTLSTIMTQAVTRRPVFLVHDDKARGEVILRALQGLLSGQLEFLTVVNHSELKGKMTGLKCVFDLQTKRFINEGLKSDTKYLELLVGSLVDQENAYARLKNELSKVLYSYGRVKDVLATVRTVILDTRLANEAAIDLSLVPLLLEMAESEGLHLKPRVQQDGLGRAIRSI